MKELYPYVVLLVVVVPMFVGCMNRIKRVGFSNYFNLNCYNCTKQNIVEDNVFTYTAPDDGGGPYNHIQYAGQEGIIRNNVFYDSNGISLGMTQYSDEARYNLAMFYQKLEMIEDAELEYNYIIYEIDSTSANPFYNLGYINLIYKGEFEKAIDFFTRAIQKNPEYVEAWYNRGFSYEVMGKLKLARENYNRSLLIKTNYPMSIKGLNRLDNGKPFKY